jgi:hypothetical protein
LKGFLPRPLAPGFWLGAFFFVLAVAFLPGAFNAATAARWALLSVTVPVAVAMYSNVPKCTLGHLLGLLLLGWAALSMLWTASLYDGADALWKLLLLAGLFVAGGGQSSLRPAFVGLGAGIAVNSAVAIAQWYGWQGVFTIDASPAGLFANKNHLAEAAALALVGLVGYRVWWLVPPVLPSLLLTNGRAAVAGVLAAATLWLWPRSRLTVLALVGAGLAYCIAHLGDQSISDRFNIWRDTAAGLTLFGNGAGSFFTEYPAHAFYKDLLISRPAHAHNDYLELLFDLGPGVAVYLALLGAALCAPRPIERAVLLAFMTEACFAFPLHLPVTAAVAALAAGHLCGARGAVRDDVARWRMAYRRWPLALAERGGGARAHADGARGIPA